MGKNLPFPQLVQKFLPSTVHPGRLTWNLKITQLKRKIIFQTIIFKFHVNLPGCIPFISSISCWAKESTATSFKTASTWPMAGMWNKSQVPETQNKACFKYLEDIYPISKVQKISDVQYHIHQPPQTSILSKPTSGGQPNKKTVLYVVFTNDG